MGTEPVDVFCANLSFIHGTTLPYAGAYGHETQVDGVPEPLTGWSSENYLQAQRGIDWIKSRAQPGRLAIVAGYLSSSDADAPGLTSLNPATTRLFRQTFSEAVAPGSEPDCDLCQFPENPYGAGGSFWLSHIFTHGLDVRVVSSQRTLTEKSVQLNEEPFQGTVAEHFGRRVELRYPVPW